MALADSEPLSASEESHPGLLRLVRRFNPSMVLPIAEVWPVEVRYAWHDGSDLRARVEGGFGQRAREWVAVPHRELERRDWSGLPAWWGGRAIRYYLDAPGDDRLTAPGALSSWRQRFGAINRAGLADPRAAPYPPTQYVHAYWWNRGRGLIALQYWFYYPFNEWVNHHEGDWERIQIVLQAPPSAGEPLRDEGAFRPTGYQYFFHQSWTEPRSIVSSGRPGDDQHPVVFVGGSGEWFGWRGSFSGGSYPLPGRYRRAGCRPSWLAPDEQVTANLEGQGRFIPAEHFRVILLPEPERLDAGRRPELSWLRLPVHAGQRQSHLNPPGHQTFGLDESPVQPGVRISWRSPPTTEPYRDLPAATRGAVPRS